MSTRAALAAILLGLLTLPAPAGEATWVVIDARPAWYDQEPWIGTGPGHYYSRHPDHIPAWPQPLRGHPVPIYSTSERGIAPRLRAGAVRHGAHADWCAARYRSYDARSDTWQPHHGPRRVCRSPWR